MVDVHTGAEVQTNEFRFTWCKEHGEAVPRQLVPKTYKGVLNHCSARSAHYLACAILPRGDAVARRKESSRDGRGNKRAKKDQEQGEGYRYYPCVEQSFADRDDKLGTKPDQATFESFWAICPSFNGVAY